MSFVVVATWTARAGHEEDVRTAIEKLVEPSRAEPGCLVYQPQRSVDDGRVFLLYEVYRSRDDYDAHQASEHFRRHALEEGIPLLESRERAFFETFFD